MKRHRKSGVVHRGKMEAKRSGGTVASQQEGRGFKSRFVQHVRACSRAFLCGVCMFVPVFPWVRPIEPHNNKNMQNRCSSVLSLTKTGLGTWTWSPGAAMWQPTAPGIPWGRMPGWVKGRNYIPPTLLTACVCVCVLCVTTHPCVCMPCGD